MKILIITQKVDKNDPILGFFHRWIEEFAKRLEFVTVVCLEKGEHDLPSNTKILSLGKEEGRSKAEFLSRFYRFIWVERSNYDAVFVHMNQEYVLLAGDIWRLMGKKIYLWRNHAYGNLLTNLSVLIANTVFCTSPSSYTAKFKKTRIMPVGVDTDFFKPDTTIEKIPNSILFLGRISPVKRVSQFLEWFNTLPEYYTATIAGQSLPQDKDYESVIRAKANPRVSFVGPVTHEEALRLYRTHETYANFTEKGSFDKTVFEAAACEMKIVTKNSDLENALCGRTGSELRGFVVENHSIKALFDRLAID